MVGDRLRYDGARGEVLRQGGGHVGPEKGQLGHEQSSSSHGEDGRGDAVRVVLLGRLFKKKINQNYLCKLSL